VKKRGAQGLKKRPGRGTTTEAQARGISGMLQAMESGGALDTDAPEQVARAIQRGIARSGTKPHWFMRSAMPEIEAYLDVQIKIAVDDAASAAHAA
jgi:hypothetical protein